MRASCSTSCAPIAGRDDGGNPWRRFTSSGTPAPPSDSHVGAGTAAGSRSWETSARTRMTGARAGRPLSASLANDAVEQGAGAHQTGRAGFARGAKAFSEGVALGIARLPIGGDHRARARGRAAIGRRDERRANARPGAACTYEAARPATVADLPLRGPGDGRTGTRRRAETTRARRSTMFRLRATEPGSAVRIVRAW